MGQDFILFIEPAVSGVAFIVDNKAHNNYRYPGRNIQRHSRHQADQSRAGHLHLPEHD